MMGPMKVTNYFRLAGVKTCRSNVFPFLDGDRDDTTRAWELAVVAALGDQERIAVWRKPKCHGEWSEGRLVGVPYGRFVEATPDSGPRAAAADPLGSFVPGPNDD